MNKITVIESECFLCLTLNNLLILTPIFFGNSLQISSYNLVPIYLALSFFLNHI